MRCETFGVGPAPSCASAIPVGQIASDYRSSGSVGDADDGGARRQAMRPGQHRPKARDHGSWLGRGGRRPASDRLWALAVTTSGRKSVYSQTLLFDSSTHVTKQGTPLGCFIETLKAAACGGSVHIVLLQRQP